MLLIVKRCIVLAFDLRLKYNFKKKALKIIFNKKQERILTNLPAEVASEFKEFWKPVLNNTDILWLKIYGSVSGLWDKRYVSERIYYSIIEPCLNNKAFSKAYNDKNFYKEFISGIKLPQTYIKNVDGVFYNDENAAISLKEACAIIENSESFMIKPSIDSGGGRNVNLYRKSQDVFTDNRGEAVKPDELFKRYKKNFIVQEVIKSHEFYADFNPSSLNTVRVFTYRSVSDERIHVLHSILRVGKQGSVTDNQASGGFACGVTEEGCLTGMAVNKLGCKLNEVNGINLVKGVKLEGYEKIIEAAVKTAKQFLYSRLLGFDLCIDSEGEVNLIEVNNVNNEINFYQMLNGSLFGEFSEEILAWISTKEKSFMIDFEI